MPIDLSEIVSTAGVGYAVREYTGNNTEAAKAAATGAWIQSVTGSAPYVVQLDGRRAKLLLSPQQVKQMQSWLDDMVKTSLSPVKQQAIVEYELSPVFQPWALKYALPTAGLFFLAGFVIRGLID